MHERTQRKTIQSPNSAEPKPRPNPRPNLDLVSTSSKSQFSLDEKRRFWA